MSGNKKTPQDVRDQGELIKKEIELAQKMKLIQGLRARLVSQLGDERFESIVENISVLINNNNLDITPIILEDLFKYVLIVVKI